MHYGAASYGGQGNPAIHGDYPASYAGHPWTYADYPANEGYYGSMFINPQHPRGFTTQASSYQEVREITPYQEAQGWFRDEAGRLCNGRGEHINEWGDVIQPATPSIPLSSPAPETAPSHRGGSGGDGSQDGSHQGYHHGKKYKNH